MRPRAIFNADAGININPVEGLKLCRIGGIHLVPSAGININPVEGLKHKMGDYISQIVRAGININPVEGLKLILAANRHGFQITAGININPVEGLKLFLRQFLVTNVISRNQHQPSRGIKTT